MTSNEQWHNDRVALWRNLCDALNALENAGERPGLNLIEENGVIVRRYVDGETARVNHSASEPGAWTLEVATDLFAPGAHRTTDETRGTP